LVLAAVVWLAASVGFALDAVKTTAGKTVSGKITSVGKLEVEVERGSVVDKVPVNEIVSLTFEEEPAALRTTVRNNIRDGRYEEALEGLEKITFDEEVRLPVKQELAFLRAYCGAQLALGGAGKSPEAGKEMFTFVKEHGNSCHYLEACEVLGNLLVAVGKYSEAEKFYNEVAAAPWPDYQMRSSVAVGRAQLAQGKAEEALKSFEAVLANKAEGDLAEAQRLAATVGKARSLAGGPEFAEAIKLVEGTLEKIDPEQVDLNAHAYIALGTALRKAGRAKEALMAFLHVDLLYATAPEAHAEALANLAEMWTELQMGERANNARQTLAERYPNSPWAKSKANNP
jgi:tetratricopeptide (TPR) repeat protein